MAASTATEREAGERYSGQHGAGRPPQPPKYSRHLPRGLPGALLRIPTPRFSTSSTPCSAERSLDVVLKVFRCQVRDISMTFLTISYSNLILI